MVTDGEISCNEEGEGAGMGGDYSGSVVPGALARGVDAGTHFLCRSRGPSSGQELHLEPILITDLVALVPSASTCSPQYQCFDPALPWPTFT